MGKNASHALGVGVAVLAAAVLLATEATADIYHYMDDDGNHLFTTYRVNGMELVEVLRSQTSSSSSRGGRRARPRASHDHDAYDGLIREAADAYDIPFAFIKAVIKAESAFNPRAVSRAGAQGLMQLMPSTAETLGVGNVFDPEENIDGGTRLLRQLADRYGGDINLVLSAYNAGPGAVAQAGGIPYEATRRYIRTVYRYYQEYLAASE